MGEIQPTERELEALKVLWDRGEATVREVCDALNARGVDLAYTTVLSLLQVMEQKALVSHRRDGKAYVYAPRIERGKTFRELAGGFLERVFDGALDEYLVHALQSRKLKASELEELEAMIADAKKGAARAGTRGGKRGGSSKTRGEGGEK
jgi:BlaI family transcriptional regulator, penicillinase repressor